MSIPACRESRRMIRARCRSFPRRVLRAEIRTSSRNSPRTASRSRGVPERLLAHAQVSDKTPIFLLIVLAFDDAQQIRRMDGHRQPHAVPGLKNLPANGSDRYGATEQAAGGGGPQGDHEFRLDDRALEIVPPPATFDLVGVRPLVQPALAAQLELEM